MPTKGQHGLSMPLLEQLIQEMLDANILVMDKECNSFGQTTYRLDMYNFNALVRQIQNRGTK